MYIQKGLTLRYAAQFSNLFNSHSFSNVGLTHYFFFRTIKVGYSLTVFFFELKYTLECGFLKFGIIFILTFYISNLHFSLSCLIIFSYRFCRSFPLVYIGGTWHIHIYHAIKNYTFEFLNKKCWIFFFFDKKFEIDLQKRGEKYILSYSWQYIYTHTYTSSYHIISYTI